MFRKAVIASLLSLSSVSAFAHMDNIHRLKAMFSNMVVKKNIHMMPVYYAKNFVLHTNGELMRYAKMYSAHAKIYQTPIQYRIQYDPAAFVESKNGVGARVFISVKKSPMAKWQKIEVLLLARYQKGKLAQMWEVTYPSWQKMKTFKSIAK